MYLNIASSINWKSITPINEGFSSDIDIIDKAPLVYQHGDFHPSNLIYQKDGTIKVIDFNRWEVSSAYEEFVRLQSFTRQISIPYCIGQIDSYFNDEIPKLFWKCFKYM